MIKDIVDILKGIFLRHKGVHTFRYQGDDHFNSQNNFKQMQVYVDNVTHTEYNLTTNICKLSLEIYILGQPSEALGTDVVDVQDNAYTIASNVMAYIDNERSLSNIMNVYDFSILTLSHYTSDDSSGVKLSLVLNVPNPVNLCTLMDNFNDEPYEEKEEKEITINKDEVGRIDLKPIKLRPNC